MALSSVTSGSPDGGGGAAVATLDGTGREVARAATTRGGTGDTIAGPLADEREATGGDNATAARVGSATGADANGRTVAGLCSAIAVRSMLAGPADGSMAADAGEGDADGDDATAVAVIVGTVLSSTLRLCRDASINPGETTLRDWSHAQYPAAATTPNPSAKSQVAR